MQIHSYYLATEPEIHWKFTGEDCWDECDQRGGKCLHCGESGYCCRNQDQPWNANAHFSTWNGDCPFGAIQAALKDRHQCLVLKQGSL